MLIMSYDCAKLLTLFARDMYASAAYPLARKLLASHWRGRLLVLTFHRVLPESLRAQYPLPGLVTTPSELRWILESVAHYFRVMTVSSAVAELARDSGKKPLLAITFDDGQWDNYEFALPVLESLSLPGTFYVPTGQIGTAELLWHDRAAFWWSTLGHSEGVHSLPHHADLSVANSPATFVWLLKNLSAGRRSEVLTVLSARLEGRLPGWARLMNWDEIRDVARRGHEVGSHAVSHEILSQLTLDQQRAEIDGSRREMERRLGAAPTSFCYPNGTFDEHSKRFVQMAGYSSATTTSWGVNDAARDRFELLRCDMDARRCMNRNGTLSVSKLMMKLVGLQPGL